MSKFSLDSRIMAADEFGSIQEGYGLKMDHIVLLVVKLSCWIKHPSLME